jgi:ADP-ribosyl-[dinitrogen reductase] hydrolase
MRVSPVGFGFDTQEKVMQEAAETAIPTHYHPEGIKGYRVRPFPVGR